MRFASVLKMKSKVLICLCFAVAAGACADGVGGPTRPTASATSGSRLSLTTGPAVDATAVDSHGQLPFQGSLEATDTDTVSFPFLSVHLTGTGEATHLGRYTAAFDFRVDL